MKLIEILVTNDDGLNARGVNEAAALMRTYGNVTVVAPSEPQSGKSSAISLENTLRLNLVETAPAAEGLGSLRIYSFTGTPVDCVKMGVNIFIEEGRMPDLLVSGINHGSNASVASVYSGTLGAAAEGAIYDIPSIGLSLCSHKPEPDFAGVLHYSRIIMDKFLKTGIGGGIYLNVNFPNIPLEEIKGIKIAHQGHGRWIREFEKRTDPRGRDYYWIIGRFLNLDEAPDADHNLVDNGYVSIVPHRVDNTDYQETERLRDLWSL